MGGKGLGMLEFVALNWSGTATASRGGSSGQYKVHLMGHKNRPVLRSFPDRVRQIILFEIGGLLLITPPFVWLSGVPVEDSIVLLATIALVAAVWNGCYNTMFDWFEGRATGRTADQRPFRLRVAHALGFEGGLLMLSLPIVMWLTGMGWLAALIADLGLATAYICYAFGFNLLYDRTFPIVPKQKT